METSQKTTLFHDDVEAQMLLERIREKMIRKQTARENGLELSRSPELNQNNERRCM